jgi:hypothetical protein
MDKKMKYTGKLRQQLLILLVVMCVLGASSALILPAWGILFVSSP